MESSNKDLGDKIRTIATVLGEFKEKETVCPYSKDNIRHAIQNVESWIKKSNRVSIEAYNVCYDNETPAQVTQVRIKGILFSRTVYYNENGEIDCYAPGFWEDEINNLYAKAVKLQKWREEVSDLIEKSPCLA